MSTYQKIWEIEFTISSSGPAGPEAVPFKVSLNPSVYFFTVSFYRLFSFSFRPQIQKIKRDMPLFMTDIFFCLFFFKLFIRPM